MKDLVDSYWSGELVRQVYSSPDKMQLVDIQKTLIQEYLVRVIHQYESGTPLLMFSEAQLYENNGIIQLLEKSGFDVSSWNDNHVVQENGNQITQEPATRASELQLYESGEISQSIVERQISSFMAEHPYLMTFVITGIVACLFYKVNQHHPSPSRTINKFSPFNHDRIKTSITGWQ